MKMQIEPIKWTTHIIQHQKLTIDQAPTFPTCIHKSDVHSLQNINQNKQNTYMLKNKMHSLANLLC
jgi:hypothetical protein